MRLFEYPEMGKRLKRILISRKDSYWIDKLSNLTSESGDFSTNPSVAVEIGTQQPLKGTSS